MLLIDDSQNTREVIGVILENAGYEVFTAENGAQGFDFLKKTPVELVITDLEMPKMHGLQLIEAIKQDEILHPIPVIIISTKSSEEDKQKGIKAGAQAYIVKGEFDEKTLLEVVDNCLKMDGERE